MNSDRILAEKFIENHPGVAARILETLPQTEVLALLNTVSLGQAVRIVSHLDRFSATRYLKLLDAHRAAELIEALPLDLAGALLRRLDPGDRSPLLDPLPAERSTLLRRLLAFPENSAGAIMDPNVLSVPVDIAVKEALRRVQQSPENAGFYVYVVGQNERLVGIIDMRELLAANPKDPLGEVIHTEVERISAEATARAILDHPGWQRFHDLPVVDRADTFLGVIHYAILRRITGESERQHLSRQAMIAGSALGDLYRIGLSALVRGAADLRTTRDED